VVTRVDLATGTPVTVTDQLGQPTNIVLSQDETEGYVADRQQEGLYRVNLSTGAITPVVTGLANTFALAVNQAEMLAYVTTSEFHPSSPPPGELLRVDLVTSQVVAVATGLVSPAGLCLNADETLVFVTEFGPEGRCGGALSAVDVDPGSPTYGVVTRLLTGLCGPHDVQLNAAESVAYVVEVDGRRLIAID
jgi:sugar lactone lactonase YvrE